jgi:hypothetical protein
MLTSLPEFNMIVSMNTDFSVFAVLACGKGRSFRNRVLKSFHRQHNHVENLVRGTSQNSREYGIVYAIKSFCGLCSVSIPEP